MAKKKKTILLSLSITIVIMVLIGYYIYANRNILKDLQDINPYYIIPIAILTILNFYHSGWTMKALAEPFGIKLKEHFHLAVSTSFFNLIAPFQGGAGVRAYYMKKKYNLNYGHFMSTIFGAYIIIFLVSSFLALITFLIIYLEENIFDIFLLIAFSIIFIATLLLVIFKFKFKKENFITSKINKVLDGWKIITKNKKSVIKITFFITSNAIVTTIVNKLVFLGLGIDISYTAALFLAVLRVLAIFINITPGSLGVTESLYFISSTLLQIPAPIAVLAALATRAIQVTLTLIIGPFSNFILFKKFKQVLPKSSS